MEHLTTISQRFFNVLEIYVHLITLLGEVGLKLLDFLLKGPDPPRKEGQVLGYVGLIHQKS